jgi:AcrR family transcriptional regulator
MSTFRLTSDLRREQILEAAKRCFALYGYAGTTTKGVAQAAGISEGLLFKHFPTKAVLYAEILAEACEADPELLRLRELKPSTETLVILIREMVAHFTVRRGGVVIGAMDPAKRTFAARAMSTTEAALMTRGVSQLYLSLGDTNEDGSVAVRLYHKPLVLLIWLGAVVMMLGGALSLSDRRLRIGAPKPAAKSALQPAE